MARQRQYWVVSPNVKDDEKSVGDWRNETLRLGVAIIGWAPDDYGHLQQGPKFAGKTDQSIRPGDIVLIARRSQHEPEIVGFGVVRGEYRKARLYPFDGDVYIRNLKPFRPWSRPPAGIPLAAVVQHTRALVQLHPDRDDDHDKVCRWMGERLRLDGEDGNREGRVGKEAAPNITESALPKVTFGYEVRTRDQVRKAQNVEAELLSDYERWLEAQSRKLSQLRYEKLQCDGWEKERRNLIEAKGSTSREDVRMAVGQLLDYAFQGKERFDSPNMAVLLPGKPDRDSVQWLSPLQIKVIWRDGESFLDNANGQFS